MIEIKFIPTGNIFSLPNDEAERIVKEDRGNYEIISGKIKEEKVQKINKTVQEMVVIDKEKEELIIKAKNLGISGNLKSMKVETLKEKIAEKENETLESDSNQQAE